MFDSSVFRRTVLGRLVAILCFGVALSVVSVQSSAASPALAFFNIVNPHSGKCLEIENSSVDNGVHAQIWSCVGQPGAEWRAVPAVEDRINIVNSSGKCLEVENSGLDNGNTVQQWDCVGQPGALWRVEDAGGGTSRIVNRSGKCLEVENSGTGDGSRVQQWDCVGQAGSFWR